MWNAVGDERRTSGAGKEYRVPSRERDGGNRKGESESLPKPGYTINSVVSNGFFVSKGQFVPEFGTAWFRSG